MPKRKLTVPKLREKKLRKGKEKTISIPVPKPELAEKRFERGVHDVAQSLKKAKGFERQQQTKRISQEKLVTKKKLKKLEKENGGKASEEEVAEIFSKLHRYEREEQVLKTLDLSMTARLHLTHTMLRIPALIETESPLPQYLDTIAKRPPAPNRHGSENDLHNVTSSLFNRIIVRESVSKVVTGICLLLCVPIPGRHQRPEWTKAERMAIETGKLAPDIDILRKIKQMPDTEEDDDDEEEEAKGEEPDADTEEKALRQFDGRLAGSSDEEDEEDKEEEDVETVRAKYKKALAEGPAEVEEDDEEDEEEEMEDFSIDEDSAQEEVPSGSAEGSESESEEDDDDDDDGSDSDSDSDEEDGPPRKRQATDLSRGKTAADSRFLPTLMGGYISDGGDSSDGSRRSDEAAAERMLGQRKNRRGQRARQAIWEKKYKDEARHLKNEEKNGKSGKGGKGGKDGGAAWDAKRGAVDAGDGPRWLRRKMAKEGKLAGGWDSGKEKKAAGESKAKSNEPLHPSWEAAKKAKEKAQTATFEGKKIVFD